MAEVIQRTWRSGPRKVRRSAWGYTLQVDGKQVRRFDGAWSREDAQAAMAAAIQGHGPDRAANVPPVVTMAFGEAVTKYLDVKVAEGKRTIRDDRQNLARLREAFGADTPLASITGDVIASYKVRRAKDTVKREGEERPITPATINRELASLRHLLRLAVEEWGVLDKAPTIRFLREPEGRLRFLDETEIARLLAACAQSRNPYLVAIVTVALNTGMRQGEIMGLTWERVDFSRGVILLERTKSGRRREVPMNDACDAALNALPGDKAEGRVFRKATGGAWGSIRTAWDKVVAVAKLDDFHFHDLRHTFASHMMMRGATVADLKDILGHADIKMTMRYAHLSPAHRRGAVDKLAGLTPVAAPSVSTTSAHEVQSAPTTRVSAARAVSSVGRAADS